MSMVRKIGILLAVVLLACALTSCKDLFSALEGDDDSGDDGIPEDELEIIAGLMGTVNLLTQANDPKTGVSSETPDGYPEDMTVEEIEERRKYRIKLESFNPPEEPADLIIDGSMTVIFDWSTGDSEGTLSLNGSFTLSGHSVESVDVDASATFALNSSTGTPKEGEDPISTSGGFTVDGTTYSLEDVLDEMEAYEEEHSGDGDGDGEEQPEPEESSIDASEAHFVGVGGATTYPGGIGGTVIYSIDGESWGVDHVDRDADLFGVASNDSGTVMAVGAADFVGGKPTGTGYILRTTDMQTWMPVHQTPENHPFSAVAYGDDGSGGAWVAVGGDSFVCYSVDGGDSWNKISLPSAYSSQMLWDVAYGDGMWSVVGGSHAPEDPTVWLAMSHADLSEGLENWQAVGQPPDPDGNAADHKFKGVTYTPGVGGGWLGVGDHPYPFAVEWSGSPADTATDAAIPVLTQEREPRVVESLRAPDGNYYRLIGTSDGSNARVLGNLPREDFWSMEYFETSYWTPIFGIAGGVTGESIRWVVVGGAGDVWTSDDTGSNWIRRKSDFYGMFDLTYRP